MNARSWLDNKQYHLEWFDVVLAVGANTTTAVTLDVSYQTLPVWVVIPPSPSSLPATGSWLITPVLDASNRMTGFTWNITATGLGTAVVRVGLFLGEKF